MAEAIIGERKKIIADSGFTCNLLVVHVLF